MFTQRLGKRSYAQIDLDPQTVFSGFTPNLKRHAKDSNVRTAASLANASADVTHPAAHPGNYDVKYNDVQMDVTCLNTTSNPYNYPVAGVNVAHCIQNIQLGNAPNERLGNYVFPISYEFKLDVTWENISHQDPALGVLTAYPSIRILVVQCLRKMPPKNQVIQNNVLDRILDATAKTSYQSTETQSIHDLRFPNMGTNEIYNILHDAVYDYDGWGDYHQSLTRTDPMGPQPWYRVRDCGFIPGEELAPIVYPDVADANGACESGEIFVTFWCPERTFNFPLLRFTSRLLYSDSQ